MFLSTPVETAEINNPDDLINLLEKTASYDKRKHILELNRDSVNSELVIKIMVKSVHTPSAAGMKHLAQIAVEVAEFTGDRINQAKALCYYSNFECLDKKNFNPPGLERAMLLFRETGDRKGEGICYYQQAKNLFDNFPGHNDEVLEILDKSMKIFQEIDYQVFISDCYSFKGQLYRRMSDRIKAVENFKKAAEIYEKEDKITSALACYQRMIYTYQAEGFFEEAFKYLEIKKTLIEKLTPDKIKSCYDNQEGYIFREIYNEQFFLMDSSPGLGYTILNQQLKCREDYETDYYMTLGYLNKGTGKYEQSIKCYRKAVELADNKEEKAYLKTHALLALAGTCYECGQKDMALKYYLDVYNTGGRDFMRIVPGYIMVARFYLTEMKNPDEAIKYFQMAIDGAKHIERDTFRKQYRACALDGIGQAYRDKGEFHKSIENMKEGLKILEHLYYEWGQNHISLSIIYSGLGEVYQKNNDNTHALEYMKKALEFARSKNNSRLILMAYKSLGNLYFQTDEPDMALKLYKEALSIAEEMNMPVVLWEYYFTVGKIYEKHGKNEEACKYYDSSIKVIEKMRNELKLEEFKRDFMQDKIEVYEHMIGLLVRLNRSREAFDYNEKARARAFLDTLANQKIDIHHGVRPELIAKEEELITRIRYMSSDIRKEKEESVFTGRSAFINEADEELKQLKIQYEQLVEEIKMENPEYTSFISVNPLSLSEIQPLLDKDTVIIEYFLGKDNSYVWIIGSDSFNNVILNYSEKEMTERVKACREMICEHMTAEKITGNRWRNISQKLYNMLFKDGEKYLKGKKRILIVPHRVLYYLPFQILIDSNGTLLIEKYETGYLPSASVLKYCRHKNKFKKESLLAFELGNVKAGDLSSLPGTEDEIKSIIPYFQENEIYAGSHMTTDKLYEKGDKFDILHFATHSILDPVSPLFSSLVFSDRKLNVYEIFDLNLKSYLICLSACRTGLGKETNGDELVGLTRAFIYAGTPTICSSLWDVSDVSTARLMERFYYYLKDNNKTEAMRLAQLDIVKTYPHPFFWAPFVLTGDWR